MNSCCAFTEKQQFEVECHTIWNKVPAKVLGKLLFLIFKCEYNGTNVIFIDSKRNGVVYDIIPYIPKSKYLEYPTADRKSTVRMCIINADDLKAENTPRMVNKPKKAI